MNEAADPARLRCLVRGAVQGVGFRPFVYRLARELDLAGWVRNTPDGVILEVEGSPETLEAFRVSLVTDAPPRSHITGVESSQLDAAGLGEFEILESSEGEPALTTVLPDIATCPDCLRELMDPGDRRYRYPFTNCTNCGPRYSILDQLPYDRPNTVMRSFVMCPECQAEYDDPDNRRFHAQPNACPVCGPSLALLEADGGRVATEEEALVHAVSSILEGRIVALKGLGGFQLICDAGNSAAVALLRERKQRERKPFALMYPDLETLGQDCVTGLLERSILASPESPIVLLDRRGSSQLEGSRVAEEVAPGNPSLGVMLPYTPLHHLLMHDLGRPVVATSGNLSEEPICIDEAEALRRLGRIADLFLTHDRGIVRQVDDSIVRVVAGRPMILRRARGYAPLPVDTGREGPPLLAVGPMLKNTTGMAVGRNAFISQHVGDLENRASRSAFEEVTRSLTSLYEADPVLIACDLHPDYFSTQYAERSGLPLKRVQHHLAHVLSCMAENEQLPPVLGVSWDGTGLGTDGTIWGGEFLQVLDKGFSRLASIRTFPLPGGDAAIRKPFRTALGLLFELTDGNPLAFDDLECTRILSSTDLNVLLDAVSSGVNSPRTSSAGRLFDAVSSICDLCQESRYEGQAAMRLEYSMSGCAEVGGPDDSYRVRIVESRRNAGSPELIIDWEPMLRKLIADRLDGVSAGVIAWKFHEWLVRTILQIAARSGDERVVLTGGCFQNRYLTERAVEELALAGHRPYWHQRVPPNDGGVSLGQLIAARTDYPADSPAKPEQE